MQQHQCDVLVVGAGPNGVKVANRLLDFDTLLIDKGGICSGMLNLPTDFEMASQSQHNLGVTLAGKEEDHIVTVGELADHFTQLNQAPFMEANLSGITGENNHFTATTSAGIIKARKIVMATGIMDTPKPANFVKTPRVSRYISHAPLKNQQILIVGGGDTAALAVIRHAANNTIHWVFRSSTDTVKNKVFRLWKAQIAETMPLVHTYPENFVEYIDDEKCVLKSGQEIGFDHAFVLTGYVNDSALLRSCGLAIDPHYMPIHNFKTCESSTKGIYYSGIMMVKAEIEGTVRTPFLKDADILADTIAENIRRELTS